MAQYRDFSLFPSLLSAHEHEYFGQGDPFYGGQKVSLVFARDADKIPALNRTRYWAEAFRYVDQALSGWVAEDIDNNELLQQMEDKMVRRFRQEISPLSRSVQADAPSQ